MSSFLAFVSAVVVRGAGLGRKIGVPTANLKVSPRKALPRGVFRVEVSGAGFVKRAGVCNVGTRPTVDRVPRRHVEVHIPGFRGDLYGRRLRVGFVRKLRDEKRFASMDALKAQIKKDIIRALAVRPLPIFKGGGTSAPARPGVDRRIHGEDQRGR